MNISAAKEPLLLLVHRIPYPPNKGDKIRSYHLLLSLVERYSVRLACFIDDKDDWQHVDTVRGLVDELLVLPLNPRTAKLKSLKGLASREALSLPYYYNSKMQRWVDKQCGSGCEKAVVFSSTMAQYLVAKPRLKVVADFVDVDSDKWAQYAESLSWPMTWVYQREARHLLKFERLAATKFVATAFVTEAETALFAQLAPQAKDRLITVANGVDRDYFCADPERESPYTAGHEVVAFTGAMDYWANVDAVSWFAEKIWPLVRQQQPNAEFYIVGGNPSEAVKKLAYIDGIVVTGRVPDVRPYVQYSTVAIAPLRIARGVQNKVLEAFALDKPVVMSPQAAEGLASGFAGIKGVEVVATDAEDQWVSAVCAKLKSPVVSPGSDYVQHQYNWKTNLEALLSALEPATEAA